MIIYSNDGFYALREPDGTVRLVQVLATFTEDQWCTFAAAMSTEGRTEAKIAEVRAVHTRPAVVNRVG